MDIQSDLVLNQMERPARHVQFLDMLPSSMLAPAEESSMSLVMSSSVSSSSPLWPRRFQWSPGFLMPETELEAT